MTSHEKTELKPWTGREPNTKQENTRTVWLTTTKVCNQRPSSGNYGRFKMKFLEQERKGIALMAAMENTQSIPQASKNFGGK